MKKSIVSALALCLAAVIAMSGCNVVVNLPNPNASETPASPDEGTAFPDGTADSSVAFSGNSDITPETGGTGAGETGAGETGTGGTGAGENGTGEAGNGSGAGGSGSKTTAANKDSGKTSSGKTSAGKTSAGKTTTTTARIADTTIKPTTTKAATQPTMAPAVAHLTPLDPTAYYGYQQVKNKGGDFLTAYTRLASMVEQMDANEMSVADLKLSVDEMKLVYYYYRADYPQHFWLDIEYRYTKTGDGALSSFSVTYSMSKAEKEAAQKQLQTAASQILSGIKTNMNTYQRELYIHDQLVKLTAYDRTLVKPHVHDMYGALVNKLAVCEGYARAFQYLLYQAGIPCLFVSGEGTNSSGNKELHAWNIVNVDGAYYYVDVTWDDPVSSTLEAEKPVYYANFNAIPEHFSATHVPSSDNYPLPACTATAANYFVQNNRRVDAFNEDQVVSMVKAAGLTEDLHLYVNGNANDYYNVLKNSNLLRRVGATGLKAFMSGHELILRFSS